MQHEKILTHPYFKKIQDMVYEDETLVKIANWIRNTVDEDDNIAIDKKSDFYIKEQDIGEFKRTLQQEVASVIVTAQENALVPSDTRTASVETDTKGTVTSSLVVHDTEKRILNLNETFLNTFNRVQERYDLLAAQISEQKTSNPYLESILQKYISELRNLMKDYAKISGLEAFYQKLGNNAGQVQAKTQLSEKTKTELRKLLKDVLGEVNPSRIPEVLLKLESILDATE
jgi:hypothetical protein